MKLRVNKNRQLTVGIRPVDLSLTSLFLPFSAVFAVSEVKGVGMGATRCVDYPAAWLIPISAQFDSAKNLYRWQPLCIADIYIG